MARVAGPAPRPPAGPSDTAIADAALAQFPPAVAAAMREHAVLRRWRDGELLFGRGEHLSSVLLVLQGRIRIAVTGVDGDEVFFRWQLPGEFFGLLSCVTQRPFPVDATAFEHLEGWWYDWTLLRSILATDGTAAMTVARMVGEHAGDMTNLIIARTAHSLGTRVLAVLRHLASLNAAPLQDGQSWLPISQHDIAHAVGASRQRVNVELQRLEAAGHLRLGYRSVVLLDPALTPAPPR